MKQGRIHGYPSRVRMGRGSDEIGQQSCLKRRGNPITAHKRRKSKVLQTDRPVDRVGCRVACTRLKSDEEIKRKTSKSCLEIFALPSDLPTYKASYRNADTRTNLTRPDTRLRKSRAGGQGQ